MTTVGENGWGDDPTSQRRDKLATTKRALLAAYGVETEADPASAIVDLLTDLRHLAKFASVDFDASLETSAGHQEDEEQEWNEAMDAAGQEPDSRMVTTFDAYTPEGDL